MFLSEKNAKKGGGKEEGGITQLVLEAERSKRSSYP